jgi:hypothetical protein
MDHGYWGFNYVHGFSIDFHGFLWILMIGLGMFRGDIHVTSILMLGTKVLTLESSLGITIRQ